LRKVYLLFLSNTGQDIGQSKRRVAMSETENSKSEENSEDKANNRRFDYELGMWVGADGKPQDKTDNNKQISQYDLGKAYLELVHKNATQTQRTYYAEDLLRDQFDYVSLRRLKTNITRLLKALGEQGLQINKPLEYQSEIIKGQKQAAKSKKRTLLDLIAESGDIQGIKVSKASINYASRHTTSREDKLEARYAYNIKKYKELQEAGEVVLKRGSNKPEIIKLATPEEDINEFKKRFAGSYTDINKGESWKVAEWAWAYFIRKRGQVSNLQNEQEFWVFVAKLHREYFPV